MAGPTALLFIRLSAACLVVAFSTADGIIRHIGLPLVRTEPSYLTRTPGLMQMRQRTSGIEMPARLREVAGLPIAVLTLLPATTVGGPDPAVVQTEHRFR